MINMTFLERPKLKILGKIRKSVDDKPFYVVEISALFKESVATIDAHLTEAEFQRFCSDYNVPIEDKRAGQGAAPQTEVQPKLC